MIKRDVKETSVLVTVEFDARVWSRSGVEELVMLALHNMTALGSISDVCIRSLSRHELSRLDDDEDEDPDDR